MYEIDRDSDLRMKDRLNFHLGLVEVFVIWVRACALLAALGHISGRALLLALLQTQYD